MIVDLKAHRCPTAQVLMNRVLDVFSSSKDEQLIITSIEPSLHRNLLGRIAGLDLKLSVTSVSERPISSKDIKGWGDEFDEDDYEDVADVVTISLIKHEPSSLTDATGDSTAAEK